MAKQPADGATVHGHSPSGKQTVFLVRFSRSMHPEHVQVAVVAPDGMTAIHRAQEQAEAEHCERSETVRLLSVEPIIDMGASVERLGQDEHKGRKR